MLLIDVFFISVNAICNQSRFGRIRFLLVCARRFVVVIIVMVVMIMMRMMFTCRI
jgi:hypothetical protein